MLNYANRFQVQTHLFPRNYDATTSNSIAHSGAIINGIIDCPVINSRWTVIGTLAHSHSMSPPDLLRYRLASCKMA